MKDFIEEIQSNEVIISHFTLWEVVEVGCKPVIGMGGPQSRYSTYWYAELSSDLYEFKSYNQLETFLNDESDAYGCIITAGIWLDL